MSEVVTVSGTPTLTLNDGGTATYTSGSGTDALTFSYIVSAEQTPASPRWQLPQANEHDGATITDANGNAANLTSALATFFWSANRSSEPVGNVDCGDTLERRPRLPAISSR